MVSSTCARTSHGFLERVIIEVCSAARSPHGRREIPKRRPAVLRCALEKLRLPNVGAVQYHTAYVRYAPHRMCTFGPVWPAFGTPQLDILITLFCF